MKKKLSAGQNPLAPTSEDKADTEHSLTRRRFLLCASLAAVPALSLSELISKAAAEAHGPTLKFLAAERAAPARPPLTEPRVIRASDGRNVNLALVIKKMRWRKNDDGTLTVLDSNITDCPASQESSVMCLRTYGSPKDLTRWADDEYLSRDENLDWTVPAPTLLVKPGQTLNINLHNRMQFRPPFDDDKCSPNARRPFDDKFPNCYHGLETTNLHFHGSHVSPNPPQDYVLLQLRPEGAPAAHNSAAHGRCGGDVKVGKYEFRVGPFPETQPVGTHWYHPHKHGSVAMQLGNGMAGALLVDGYFDDYLREFYSRAGFTLTEKLLVIQQVGGDLNFFGRETNPGGGPFRVNGVLNPVVRMRPGEVQRWRFVSATLRAPADVAILVDKAGLQLRQIARDGVPYDTRNYLAQSEELMKVPFNPLAALKAKLPFGSTEGKQIYRIVPGGRADFLVQAPLRPGAYTVNSVRLQSEGISEATRPRRGARREGLLRRFLNLFAPQTLFSVEVTSEPPVGMSFPAQLPPLPDHLRDITDGEINRRREVVFSMREGFTVVPVQLFIDNKKYDECRVDHTVGLNDAEEWTIKNTSVFVEHPFHIHINPFQIVAINRQRLPRPWVWADTVTLPKGRLLRASSVTIRHRFTDFTGKYVLHCHILGHEDRGMMQNVEVVDRGRR